MSYHPLIVRHLGRYLQVKGLHKAVERPCQTTDTSTYWVNFIPQKWRHFWGRDLHLVQQASTARYQGFLRGLNARSAFVNVSKVCIITSDLRSTGLEVWTSQIENPVRISGEYTMGKVDADRDVAEAHHIPVIWSSDRLWVQSNYRPCADWVWRRRNDLVA